MPLRRVVFTPSFHRESFRRRATYTRPQQSFSPFRRECFLRAFLLALALFPERERERERDHNIHSYTDLFCDLNAKALEFRESFSTHTGCFCPKKKRSFLQIITERAKILARNKTLLSAFREQKRTKKCSTRARDSLFVDVVLAFGRSVLLRKLFERDSSERENERISFVSSSKLRGVLDERTSDQRRRRRSERRFEIIRSFGDFSRSGSARLSFCSTREQQQQQQSKKKRETFERKARGFKRDQSHLQISFAASFCVFLAGRFYTGFFLLKI